MKNKPLPSIALSDNNWPGPASEGCCAWTSFWFSAVNPIGLHALRILTGLLLLAWLLPLAGHVESLFGLQGWMPSRFPANVPVFIGWSALYLVGSGPGLVAMFWLTIAIYACFTLGLCTRITAVLTWVMTLSFMTANPAARLEVDYMLVILTFYLMIGYLLLGQFGGRLSLSERLLGPWNTFVLAPLVGLRKEMAGQGSVGANLALRLFQVHFALIVVMSTLNKLQSGDWWSGVGYWYPLHPPFDTTEATIRDEARSATTLLFFLSLVQYAALAWSLSFPLWAWRARWRWLLLVGATFGLLGSTFAYRDPLFGCFFFVGCLSYLTADEWLAMRTTVARLWQLITGKEAATPSSKTPMSTSS